MNGRHKQHTIQPTVGAFDTPGMRELQFWQTGMSAVEDTFDDIHTITGQCKFHDCRHNGEPGCAVHSALEAGTLEGRGHLVLTVHALLAQHGEARKRSITRTAFFLNFINLPLLVAGKFTFGHGELMYCRISKGSILPRSEA